MKKKKSSKIIDWRDLEPGDIILTRDKSGWTSWIIRIFTNCKYSHAVMYTGNGVVAEAVSNGVHTSTIVRYNGLEGNCKVLRAKGATMHQKLIAANASTTYLGTRYGTIDALWAGISKFFFATFPIRVSDATMFCSRLVADSYDKAGVKVASIHATMVRPKDLDKSEFLEEVPVRFIEQPPLESYNSTIRFADAVVGLREEFVKVLKKFGIPKRRLGGINSVLEIIHQTNNRELDDKLAEVLRTSKFYTLIDDEQQNKPEVWDSSMSFDLWQRDSQSGLEQIEALRQLHQRKVQDYTEELQARRNSRYSGATHDAFIDLYQRLHDDSQNALLGFDGAYNYIMANS